LLRALLLSLCFAAGARHFQFRISALSSVRRAAIARRAASTRRAASAITGEGAISGPPRMAEEDGERAASSQRAASGVLSFECWARTDECMHVLMLRRS